MNFFFPSMYHSLFRPSVPPAPEQRAWLAASLASRSHWFMSAMTRYNVMYLHVKVDLTFQTYSFTCSFHYFFTFWFTELRQAYLGSTITLLRLMVLSEIIASCTRVETRWIIFKDVTPWACVSDCHLHKSRERMPASQRCYRHCSDTRETVGFNRL